MKGPIIKKYTHTLSKPWQYILLSAVAFALAYGAASWAIDSGKLTAYFIAIVLAVLGIRSLIQAFRKANAK